MEDVLVTEKGKIVLAGINFPGYYNLAIRILSLTLNKDEELKRRFVCSFVEFTRSDDIKNICDTVISLEPDFVGLSVNIWNRNMIFDLAALLQEKCPEIIIIAGGQEVTNSVVDYLGNISALDYIIDGEGEMPLLEFFRSWDIKASKLTDPQSVSGLHYRENGISHFTGQADLVKDLDDLPSPVLEGALDLRTKWRLGIMLEGTRGCPFKCSYCFEGDKKVTVRSTSLERLSEEVWYAASHGARYFHLLDPILCNSNLPRLKALSELFKKVMIKYSGITVAVEAYAHQITDEIAECMKNFVLIDIGLQTTNPETAKEIHRPWDPVKFQIGLQNLRRHIAPCSVYLIMGLPYETLASYIHGVKIVLNENPLKIFCNELLLLNGTELRRRSEEYDYDFNPEPPYGIRSNKWLTNQEFKVIQLLSKVVEKRQNFSLRFLYPTALWLPKELTKSYIKFSITPHNYPSALFQEFLRTKNIRNAFVEIVYKTAPEMNQLLTVIGQLQLSGCGWIKLTAPYSFITEDLKNLLVKRGVCQFNLLYQTDKYEDISLLQVLEHWNKEVIISNYAAIVPYSELVIDVGKFLSVPDFFKLVDECIRYNVTVISILNSNFSRLNYREKIKLRELFHAAVDHKVWLKLSEELMRTIFSDYSESKEIINDLSNIGLILDLKNIK